MTGPSSSETQSRRFQGAVPPSMAPSQQSLSRGSRRYGIPTCSSTSARSSLTRLSMGGRVNMEPRHEGSVPGRRRRHSAVPVVLCAAITLWATTILCTAGSSSVTATDLPSRKRAPVLRVYKAARGGRWPEGGTLRPTSRGRALGEGDLDLAATRHRRPPSRILPGMRAQGEVADDEAGQEPMKECVVDDAL